MLYEKRRIPKSVAFHFPQSGDQYDHGYHLGVSYLRASLRCKGIESIQITSEVKIGLKDLIYIIKCGNYGAVGFTCFDINFTYVRAAASAVRQEIPDVWILIGGPTATLNTGKVLKLVPEADICVRGEAENTIVHLMDALSSRKDLNDIPGISFRTDRSITHNADLYNGLQLRQIPHLDDFPSPYLEGILTGRECAGILTSRGCAYACTYCAFSALSCHEVRYHSLDRVFKELDVIANNTHGTPSPDGQLDRWSIVIYDDNFSMNKNRAKEFCARVIDKGLEFSFSAQCRADGMDEELLKMMRAAGFSKVNYGLESSSPEVLRTAQKVRRQDKGPNNLDPEIRFIKSVEWAVSKSSEYGLEPSTSIILGLPGDTPNRARDTLKFVDSLPVKDYSHNLLNIYVGTELANDPNVCETPSHAGVSLSAKYPYDVTSIRPLKKLSDLQKLHNTTVRYLSPILKVHFGSMTESVADLFVRVMPNGLDEKLLNWVSNSLPFNGSLVIEIVGTNDKRCIDDAFSQLRSFLLPTRCQTILMPDNGEGREKLFKTKRYSAVVGTRIFGDQYIDVQPFPEPRYLLSNENSRDVVDPQRAATLYDVDLALEDFFSFIESRSIGGAGFSITSKDVDLNTFFLEECRWSCDACPAATGHSFVIDNIVVKACRKGAPIGGIDEPLNVLKERFQSTYKKTIEERGCALCSAKAYCSKCVFTSSISVREYCEARRAYPTIGKFFKMYQEFKKFIPYDRQAS